LLNFVLIAGIALAGWRLRKEAQDFEARERASLRAKAAFPAPPAQPPAPPPPAVTAASYLDIAQKMLFSRDRNSQVIVDPPAPPKPPKPLPPLPGVHGVMDLGDGPIVMMSDKPGARHRGVRPGETIGEFKLVSVNSEELTLAFEDRTVNKKLQELIDRNGGESGSAQGQGTPSSAPTPAAAAAPAPVGKSEPNAKLSETTATCQTNDPSPDGTVVNGMRKVVRHTPFGDSCIWEAVK